MTLTLQEFIENREALFRQSDSLKKSSKFLISSNDVGQKDNSESAPSEPASILIDETHAALQADNITLSDAYRYVFISCMFCYLVTNVTLTVVFAVLANKLPARERDKDVRMYG